MAQARARGRASGRMLADDPVNPLMRWPVAAVDESDALVEVSRALRENQIGAVVVLRDGALVGVVSERDLSARLGDEVLPGDVTAGEVMSAPLVTVPPDAPIIEAARIMREAHVRHLPVVTDGVVSGILSMRDLFDVLVRQSDRRRLARSHADRSLARAHRA